jgi:uncharacterized membrane protein YhaH (DUF805 family)
MVAYAPEAAPISPKWTSISFMVSDFISLVLQAVGGAIASTADTRAASNSGRYIMIAGLAWQVLSLLVFMVVWALFVWRLRKTPETARSQSPNLKSLRTGSKLFELFQYSLLAATVLIFIRSVYRVAELQGGFGGEIANHQTTFIILESVPITLAVLLVTVLHPGLGFGGAWEEAGWSFRKHEGGKQDANMELA